MRRTHLAPIVTTLLFSIAVAPSHAADRARTLSSVLAFDALRPGARTAAPSAGSGDKAAGMPEVLNVSGPLSAAIGTVFDSDDPLADGAVLLASWDGREDYTADRIATLGGDVLGTQVTRIAISEH